MREKYILISWDYDDDDVYNTDLYLLFTYS